MIYPLRPIAGVCLAALLAAPAVSAKTVPVWRDAFQSSPATYEAPSLEMLRAVAERMKQTPEALAQAMKPQPVTGTVRYRITVSGAGAKLRVRISNEEGGTPLSLSAASVALAGDTFAARPGSLRRLTFGGAAGIAIPAGAPALSDPVDLPVTAGSELLVSLALASALANDRRGGAAFALAPGDQASAETLREEKQITGRPAVTGVQVSGGRATRVIVAIGDSITDGNRDRLGVLHGWPEQLARRLAKAGMTGYTVVNAGLGGNRLLAPGWGEAGLARLDRDALRIDGISHLIVLEGTNDIGMSGRSMFGTNPELAADDLIAGYRQVIARAHARGVKVILGTLTPLTGSVSHSSPSKEAIRQAVNRWMRTSREPDAVIDFARITGDPAGPDTLNQKYDSGDHLHPNDAGYAAMGDGIDLSLFR
ncbi:MAG: SGNH/GDSL hydrolase family protein [Novosphingobium sp.]